jgi:hypothetical protein
MGLASSIPRIDINCALDAISAKIIGGLTGKRSWKKYSKNMFLVLMPAKSLKKTIATKYCLSQNIMVYVVKDMLDLLLYGKQELIDHIELLREKDYRMYKATIYNIAMIYLQSIKHTFNPAITKIVLLHDDIGLAQHMKVPQGNIIKAMPDEPLFESIKETMEEEGKPIEGSELEKVIMERNVLKADSATRTFNFIEDFVDILSNLTGLQKDLTKFMEF